VHDHAPAHSSGVVSEFSVLFHPPYSPDLAPANFLLFPKLKIATKLTRFEAVSSIQQTVTKELKAIWEEACSRSFDSFYERYKRSGTYLSHCVHSQTRN
jgi:hypothetical protein